jgi:uncharacterized membrane protein
MTAERYPTSRIDALSDGIFGVAMTLLVLDVKLADDFHPSSAKELSRGLVRLWPKFFPYAVSFVVLGLRWLSNVQYRPREESVSLRYCLWCLAYLLLVTCLPFSTAVIGRFSSLAPALWLYAANAGLMGVVSLKMMRRQSQSDHWKHGYLQRRYISQAVLIASSVVAVLVSFASVRLALWVYLLNFIAPVIVHRMKTPDPHSRGPQGTG